MTNAREHLLAQSQILRDAGFRSEHRYPHASCVVMRVRQRKAKFIAKFPASNNLEWGRVHLLREAYALGRAQDVAGVAHRVAIYEAEGGLLVLVREFVNGLRLMDWKALGQAPDPAAITHLRDVLIQTIGSLHEAGLCCLDINEVNIIVFAQGEPCVIDLGSSQFQEHLTPDGFESLKRQDLEALDGLLPPAKP